jgi:polysaccharide export outer membrane protein
VWQNPDLSITVPVRPDGRISLPLLQDVTAMQKTPAQLAEDIKKGLSTYLQDPIVTVIVTEFVGPYSRIAKGVTSTRLTSETPRWEVRSTGGVA